MWHELAKLIKPNGAIVLFGSEPFSSALRLSNIDWYKYDWVWDKNNGSNFGNVKKRPLKVHETVSVFSLGQHFYFPQLTGKTGKSFGKIPSNHKSEVGSSRSKRLKQGVGYPKSIQYFPRVSNLIDGYQGHPTQKPVALMEYLIRTYTNEGETVLDFTMGSGSTGVAAINTNRKFIGIEQEKEYFEIAQKRISEAIKG